jgi:hypothetical protein
VLNESATACSTLQWCFLGCRFEPDSTGEQKPTPEEFAQTKKKWFTPVLPFVYLQQLAFGISPSSIALQDAEREDGESSGANPCKAIHEREDPDTQLAEKPVELMPPVIGVAEPSAKMPVVLLLLLLWARDTAIARASSTYRRNMCRQILQHTQR